MQIGRTARRLLACSLLAVIAVVGAGITPASAATYNGEDVWEERDASPVRATSYCNTRTLTYRAGTYRWVAGINAGEPGGGLAPGEPWVAERRLYLNGTYDWTTCMNRYYSSAGGYYYWAVGSRLTNVVSGGKATIQGTVPHASASCPRCTIIYHFGSVLFFEG